ncbi:DUF460 domain-containing protein [Candidatus Woesearchaeota archaeon]|nr:DUF460 domain-containing protein [Candidatus Woesearchaeota archaeon]HIH48124.1 DUF460 domain-containing protein [Candidatus Woesearchaeota archaeon]
MGREPIIVGVDPGTTLAYAVFSLSGEILVLYSSKEFGLNSLIARLYSHGRPVIIGTDKKIAPHFIEKLRMKTGAKLSCPEEDIKVAEKVALSRDQITRNDHERDAYIAGLFAYKLACPRITKIKKYLAREGKEALFADVARIVLPSDFISIKMALEMLEKPTSTTPVLIRETSQEKPDLPPELTKLHGHIKRLEQENKLLYSTINDLRQEIKAFESQTKRLTAKINSFDPARKARDLLSKKEQRIIGLDTAASLLKNKAADQERTIKSMAEFIRFARDKIIIHSVPNLSKFSSVTLKKGDFLLVENPTVFSAEILETLAKDDITLIIKGRVPEPIKKKFLVLQEEDIVFKRIDGFIAVTKESLDLARKNSLLLESVINQYRAGRG